MVTEFATTAKSGRASFTSKDVITSNAATAEASVYPAIAGMTPKIKAIISGFRGLAKRLVRLNAESMDFGVIGTK